MISLFVAFTLIYTSHIFNILTINGSILYFLLLLILISFHILVNILIVSVIEFSKKDKLFLQIKKILLSLKFKK